MGGERAGTPQNNHLQNISFKLKKQMDEWRRETHPSPSPNG
jgi:hypothetical protein